MSLRDTTAGAAGALVDHEAEALLLEAALAGVEVPDAAACARLASAWDRAGDRDRAVAWAVRTVDGGRDFTAWRSAARLLDRLLPGGAPREAQRLRVAIAGTATTAPLVPCLRLALARERLGAILHEAPYGQYWQEPIDPSSALRRFGPDVVVLVPDHHAAGLGPAVDDHPAAWVEEALERLTAPWDALSAAGIDVVQVSLVEPPTDPLGDLAAGHPGSRRARLRQLNQRLAEAAAARGVGFVDADAVASRVGRDRWFDDRFWHAAKHAVAMAAVPDLAVAVASTVAARRGLARRCVVLDLDNTLWGGVIGDDGLEGIVLTGTRGEAHVALQRALLDLAERGVVLAVCSKNDDATAREPFERHPDMVLGLDRIASFQASWATKPAGIRAIAEELGLGLDAMVFVDDNPAEREAVRLALPEVDVLVLPDDPARWAAALHGHPRLQPAALTVEDRRRTDQYRARAQARALEQQTGNLEELQERLAMTVTVERLGPLTVERAAQLLAKTNQFNLTTQRHPLERVRAMAAADEWAAWGLRLRDRFDDHGLIAVVLAQEASDVLDVDSFVMSCRVIGRGVERVVMRLLVEEVRRRGLAAVRGHYRPTDRNGLVADLWPALGLSEVARTPEGAVTYELTDLARAVTGAPIEIVRSEP